MLLISTVSGAWRYMIGDTVIITDKKRSEIRISGHGEADVNVSKDLDVAISGMGTLRYRGDPKLNQSISGAGSVKRVDA